tara:strand:- start:1497 stop:1808 length:312 start_codon:yes stop_codon:yes gene_type:complete
MNLQEVIAKLQFIHDDEEIMSYIHEKEKAHEDFNGEKLAWNKNDDDDDSFSVGWTVQEVLDAQNEAYRQLGLYESTGETLDRSDFSDEEWCDWIEEILTEGRS